ncbi:MAG: outer membrane lipoprotein-sorting protein [Alphaproteobacteria bacterium]|nr:outer membrane lipoprotein-sorting protein [Alphaproteobacteria bacterium]
MGAHVSLEHVRWSRREKTREIGTMKTAHWLMAISLIWCSASIASAAPPDAEALLRAAYDNWRANSSTTEVAMTVHRPDWQRSLRMKAWTRGDDDALVRFVAPAQDAGNATLKLGDDTWVFNPKLNQVIKLPASMMEQSWMGSDFSYNDLSKANDLLTKYTHRLIDTKTDNGHTIYTIEAIPKPGAPVVWGKQVVKVRDDGVLLAETYFDQDMKPVREMTTEQVGPVGGRAYPKVMTMRPSDEPGKWTRIETLSGEFDKSEPAYLFTLSNLQNPRN